jgi:CBS domain-containing protein
MKGHVAKGHARTMMTAHVTAVTVDTSLADIARTLHAGGFGGVPVVDDQGTLVGFVSDADIMDAFLVGKPAEARAAEFMSTPAVTVDEFDRTDDVMRILREHRIHHLPVVRQGRLVGIITPSDIIRFMVEQVLPIPPEVG